MDHRGRPPLALGGTDSDAAELFHRVSVARYLSDGSIVIADGGSSELRVFGPTGAFVRSIGRHGQGPGEFATLDWVQVLGGDTLLVLDTSLRRLTAQTLEEGVAWTIPLEGSGYPWPADIRLSDGAFLIFWHAADVLERGRAGTAEPGRTYRSPATLVRYEPAGTPADTIGTFPGVEEALLLMGTSLATTYPTWGKTLAVALRDDAVLLGTQEAPEISVYSRGGERLAVLRWPPSRAPIGEEQVEAFLRPMLLRAEGDTAAQRAMREHTESVPHPEMMPEYGRVLVDDEGRLWISEPTNPLVEPTRWGIVDLERGTVGSILLPEGFRLFDVKEGNLLGLARDALGVEIINVLRLVPSGGA